jgi:hypothetical protein
MNMRKGNIVATISFGRYGKIKAQPFHLASHVLIDVVQCVLPEGKCNYDFYGSTVQAECVNYGTATAVYYKIDQYLKPRTRNILGLLSRHFLNDTSFFYNDICALENVAFGARDNTVEVGLEYRIKMHEIKNLEHPKISGEHHLHFFAHEVFACVKNKKRAFEALRLPREATTTMVAGVMLWLDELDDDMWNVVNTSRILDAPDVPTFIKMAKRLSVRAKSYQNIVFEDLKPIFESDVLTNRAYGQVDWEGEKLNRTKPRLSDVDADFIYKQARKIFGASSGRKRKPAKLEWSKFWKARWQWSAAGSIHSQYTEDMKDVPAERHLRNKFIALIQKEDMAFSDFADRERQLVAWSSIKYEWGKQRAIYGTDLTSYILAHFAFYNCEDCLPAHFPVGKNATPRFVKQRVAAILEDAVPLCVDFEDFNSQHSIEGMQAVIAAYADEHADRLTEEQLIAMRWTSDSLNNTIIQDNMGTKTHYQVRGTLMSGWRLTTFMNSVLNYIYTLKLYGETNTQYRSIHNGDDIMIGCNNFVLAREAVAGGLRANIRLQRSKCSFGGLAEFLRVDHVSGEAGQYLTRNIATMMHSRIESKVAVKAADVIEAMEERFAEFRVRGGSQETIARLRRNYYKRMAPIHHLTEDEFFLIKSMHRVAGGISERKDARVDYERRVFTSSGEVTLPDKLPGIRDYAVRLHRELELDVEVDDIVDKVRNATEKAVRLERNNEYITVARDEQLLTVWRALYKVHAQEGASNSYGKAKMVGFLIDVLEKRSDKGILNRVISDARDRMKFLSVIT